MKKLEKRKYVLKNVGVLLIAALMVLSTIVVTANTEKPQKVVSLAINTAICGTSQPQTNNVAMASCDRGWVYYHNGFNNNAVGLSSGGTYQAAIRLTPDELAPDYCDCELTEVKFYHYESGTHSGYIKIYGEGTSTSPGMLIGTEPYTATGDGWICVILSNPIVINCLEDLWVSVEITHEAGEYPIGVDAGPAVAGKGDWIYIDPGSWGELQHMGMDYNWCIEVYIDCLGSSKIKWEQLPDETPNGIDICIRRDGNNQRTLADDFKCITTGSITDIHLWGSWMNDENDGISMIHLSIHDDIPASQSPTNYSMPGEELWSMNFYPGDFYEWLYYEGEIGEWWWDSYYDELVQYGDKNIYQYDFYIDEDDAFVQTGTPEEPVVYWLDVYAETNGWFGWKTSNEHWNDDAVMYTNDYPYWLELRYPSGHPYQGESIDMAFVITTNISCEYNHPPNTPIITGPTNGIVWTIYEYKFQATDPDYYDKIFYIINWGDTPIIYTYGDYPAGFPLLRGKIWTTEDTFTIKAKARDICGAESNWGFLEVTMPLNQPLNSQQQSSQQSTVPLFFQILQRLMNIR